MLSTYGSLSAYKKFRAPKPLFVGHRTRAPVYVLVHKSHEFRQPRIPDICICIDLLYATVIAAGTYFTM